MLFYVMYVCGAYFFFCCVRCVVFRICATFHFDAIIRSQRRQYHSPQRSPIRSFFFLCLLFLLLLLVWAANGFFYFHRPETRVASAMRGSRRGVYLCVYTIILMVKASLVSLNAGIVMRYQKCMYRTMYGDNQRPNTTTYLMNKKEKTATQKQEETYSNNKLYFHAKKCGVKYTV